MKEGDWISNKIEGYGKYYWEDDKYYIGQFKNNLRHGKGIIYYKVNNVKYECNFINGKREAKN